MVTRRGATLGPLEAEGFLEGPASNLPPLVLAAGPEDFLRDRVVGAFRAGAEREGSEFQRLEGDDVTAEELAQALASVSLFGSGRRIWIREAARLERRAEEALLAWAEGSGEGVRVLATSSRDVAELKSLQALAARGAFVTCAAAPGETLRWAERMAQEAGLKLPGSALEALAARASNLLALSGEIEKLRLHAASDGRVQASALDVLARTRGGASEERWAAAVLARDFPRARREAAVLEAEGGGGTGSLWALAERALAALDPQPYGYTRRRAAGPPLGAAEARRVLDVVYRADRALKRGEIRDQELREYVERAIAGADHVV